MSMEELNCICKKGCPCGKSHTLSVDQIVVGSGVIKQLPQIVKKYRAKKAFVLSDKNTYRAAGRAVCAILKQNDISFSSYSFDKGDLEPDEQNVGLADMYFDNACDIIIGVGSGVINDIGKILSAISGKTYIIVATAPSMDGYASATSSMTREGLKISLPSRSADVIIGDTDILCQAPLKLMQAGLGDMLAKYVSICEWRISHLINEEYYCEEIAALVRSSLKQCIELAPGLLRRDEAAVAAVFKGLVICGAAMSYAGLSRPASGVEHYISHVWDMRGAALGTPVELHGIQCAVGTLLAVRMYEQVRRTLPDREKALNYVKNFDLNAWNDKMRDFLGKGAECMIALEKKEQKYNVERHRARLEIILHNWEKLLDIIAEELPSSQEIETLLDSIGAPKSMEDIGLDAELLPMTFQATKDIRDKYVLSRLAWDLGILEELTPVSKRNEKMEERQDYLLQAR